MMLFSYFKNRQERKKIISEVDSLIEYDAIDTALNKILDYVEEKGGSRDIFMIIAELYFRLEEDTKAEKWLTMSIDRDPLFFLGYFYRGQLLLREKKYEEAISDLDRAILLFKREPLAYMKRGMCYAALNNYKKALPNAIAYSRLTDNKEEAYNLVIATAIAASNMKAAKKYTKKLMELTGEPMLADPYTASTLGIIEDVKGAEEKYTKSIEMDPNNFKLLCQRGNYYISKREFEKGIIDFQRAIECDTFECKDIAYEGLGLCYKSTAAYDKTIECYKKVIELGPDKHYIYYEIAEYYHSNNNLEEAVKYLELGEENCMRWPFKERTRLLKGEYYYQIEEYDLAFNLYSEVIADGYNVFAYMKMAKCKMQGREYNKALEYYMVVMENEGSSEDEVKNFINMLNEDLTIQHSSELGEDSNIYSNEKDSEDSDEDLEEDLEEEYDEDEDYDDDEDGDDIDFSFLDEEYYYELAKCYEALEEYDKAFKCYNLAILKDPMSEVSFNGRGCLSASLKKYSDAIRDFEEAIVLCPNVVEYKYNLALCYKEIGDFEKTIEIYEDILKEKGENEFIYMTLGKLCIHVEKMKRAQMCFNSILKINPDNKEAYYYIGYIKYFENKFEEAIENINRSIENEDSEAAVFLRARCYLESGDYSCAIEDFSSLINKSSNHEYYLYRGMAKSSLKDYEGAGEDYTRTIEILPSSVEAYISRGNNYQTLKKYKEAINDYQKAGNVNYNYKYIAFFNIGVIYDILGEDKKALYFLEKSLKINPTGDKIKEINQKIEEITIRQENKKTS
ncbi:MAG: tetratricopeptide repeat protein [Clostridium sp.]